MAILGRKTLKSSRARMRRIDQVFEWAGKIFLVAYFIFVFISWLSYRESFRIDTVLVSGTYTTSRDDIQLVATQFLSLHILWKIDRNNAVFYPKKNLSEALYSLDSHIKHVDMSVEKKKNLEIRITEYAPGYLWCGTENATSTNECYLADFDGYIYARSPDYTGFPFPIFYTYVIGSEEQGTPIGFNLLPPDEYAKISMMINLLTKNNIIVSQVHQTDEFDYTLITDRSWVLHWSSTKDPIKSIENLKLVLSDIQRRSQSSTEPISIDLRFGNKIFYK